LNSAALAVSGEAGVSMTAPRRADALHLGDHGLGVEEVA
jgi:hypothetical protein